MGILTAPLRAFLFLAEEIADRAYQSVYGEEAIRAALEALYADLREDRIDEAEFERRESELIARLRRGKGGTTS